MSTRSDWPQGLLNRERTLQILREHNAWRRGAKGPQTDPRMLGLALDAAIEALASPPQPPSGGVVRAKPLEWQEDGPGEWCDRHHGFHITQDDEEPKENRFTAAWGEGDPEWFPTLKEAQEWCQEAIDRYIREWAATTPASDAKASTWDEAHDLLLRAVASQLRQRGNTVQADVVERAALTLTAGAGTAPPSAPVGDDNDEPAKCEHCGGHVMTGCVSCGESWATPSAPVGVEDVQRRLDREESDHERTIDQRDAAEDAIGRMFQAVTGRPAEWSSAWGFVDAVEEVEEHVAALAQQPAAVDGAMVRRLDGLARRWDESANNDKHDDRRATKRKCAADLRALTAALATQPGGAE